MTSESTACRVALVVDDSMLIRHTVCRFLEERGFVVEAAMNGLEALKLLSGIRPDIIVTDLSMPKMTGSQLIGELKRRPEYQDTPIVVLAARRSADDMVEEARADQIIFKDIDIEDQLERMLQSTFAAN